MDTMKLVKSAIAAKIQYAIGLLKEPTVKQIEAVIAKAHVDTSSITCDCCHNQVDTAVEFYLENDAWDGAGSCFPNLCEDCLRAALRLIERG